MTPIINHFTIPFLLLLGSIVDAQTLGKIIFDITKYGGKPSETLNINQALLKAWSAACASPSYSEIVIPQGNYLLGEVDLAGPCKAPIALKIIGNLNAPKSLEAHTGDHWIRVGKVSNILITGGGTLNGEGSSAWQHNVCQKDPNCKNLPINLRLDFVQNGIVEDIKSIDSKNFHFNILQCRNITIRRVTIQAPQMSPNTDGIHMGRSEMINIENTKIGTGDDCISIGDDTKNVKIVDVSCGPGHGISVGSLGKYVNEGPVTGVTVKRCTINNADNGVRIKTWPGMYASTASAMVFEDITMNNVSNPILIDQMYCPSNHCDKKTQSNVKLSKISFRAPVTAECINIKPRFTGKILPAGC
ncbi:Pectin lyase-like superfamily protein [Euphorbia peplus]|nr:Pectin lyase-like superfamily protein [Euphorbia peplus]